MESGPLPGLPGRHGMTNPATVDLAHYFPAWLNNSVGPYGENGWIEDYTAGVRGEPIRNITLITSNSAGKAQRIVGNYRPRTTLLVFSRLLGEKFAGTPIAGHFSPASPEEAGTS
jgi:hypothetical protein